MPRKKSTFVYEEPSYSFRIRFRHAADVNESPVMGDQVVVAGNRYEAEDIFWSSYVPYETRFDYDVIYVAKQNHKIPEPGDLVNPDQPWNK